jgi:hypothetical protein
LPALQVAAHSIPTLERAMRTLIATAILLSGAVAMTSTADAARKSKRGPAKSYYYVPPGYGQSARYQRESVECERARNEDPAGQYAGYPCWAREIFARGSGSGRR